MIPTFDQLAPTYTRLWEAMKILPNRTAGVDQDARRILLNKARYQAVSTALGGEIPWWFIGCIHYRESNLNFHCHLHNGDPLNQRTRHVPANRPPAPAQPPFTWEESAADALRMRGLEKPRNWSVERAAFEWEGFNGWGYFCRHQTSSYDWAASNEAPPGKFVADGKYAIGVVDAQDGLMPVLRELMQMDPTIAFEPHAPEREQKAPMEALAPPMLPSGNKDAPWEGFIKRWLHIATVIVAFAILAPHLGF
jgi:lysozyme family protein